MTWKTRAGAVAFGIGMCALLLMSATGLQVITVAICILGIGLGVRLYPGLWRPAGRGALCGAAAGLLVLGPGFRIAMRAVAIADPARRPEFTLAGTLFIIVIVGVVFGAIVGMIGTVEARAFRLNKLGSGLLLGGLVMSLISLDPNLRSELLELGAGPWLNIPMFAGVAFAYGVVTSQFVARMERRRQRKLASPDRVEVPA